MKTSDWRNEKYPILFKPKDKESGWDGSQDDEFWEAVRAVKKECVERCETENREIEYDFSDVHFPDFTSPVDYFNNQRIFNTATLFWETGEVYGFEKHADFRWAEFQSADFGVAEFQSADFYYIDSESFLALHAKFTEKLRFDYATIKKIVFTGDALIQHFSCLHATFEEAYFNGATIHDGDRDAFRILKKSFDEQGDHIQANEYYSHEMAAYGKELEGKWKTHFEDKIIFYLSQAISNFSQSWFQPLLWILYWSIFLYFFQSLHNGMLSNQVSFNELFQFINPFETNYTDGNRIIYGWWLLHKIGLSFLLYHFVVALRRQMKR